MPNNEKVGNIICKESVEEIINKRILKIYESSEYRTKAYKIKDKLGKLSNRLESSQWINQTYNNMRKKELVDSNFKTGSPKLDNTEKLLKYLSDISEDITEIFKLLRICREVKSSPKIIAWMKHNKLICESAGMLYKKNFAQLKALNAVETNKDKDTILKYITTLFKDKVLSENYFDEENYKGEKEVNNEKSNEENLNGPAKEIKNEIKTAVLKEKVKSLEGQLEEIPNDDVRRYLNDHWQADCKYSNEGVFWPTVQSITEKENTEDIDMGGLYRSTDVEEIESKTDANSKFDFLEGPEGETIGATGIWHRKFPEKGGKEGWQIDISPVPPVCAYVLGIVDSVIKKGSFKCEFKWQGDLRIYRGNAKITNKVPKQYRFIVIYPENDTQSRNIAKALHDAFRKANLNKEDFVRPRDAFEIYPGLYTTFRKFTGESSNTSVCIPIDKTVLKKHIEKEGKSEMTYEHPFPSLIWRGKPLPKNVNELSKIVELRLKNKDKNDEKREEKEKLKLKKDDLKRKIIDTQKLKDVFVNNGDLTPYFDYNPDFVEAYYANGSYPNYKIDKGELYHQFKSDPEKAFNKVQADLKSSFSSFIGTCLSLGMESQSLSDFFSKNHILHLDNFQDKKNDIRSYVKSKNWDELLSLYKKRDSNSSLIDWIISIENATDFTKFPKPLAKSFVKSFGVSGIEDSNEAKKFNNIRNSFCKVLKNLDTMISPIYDSKLFEKEDNKNIRFHIAQMEEQHNSVDRENGINTEIVRDDLVDLINKNKQYFDYEENNEKIPSKETKNVVKMIKMAEESYKYLKDKNIQVENTGDTNRPKGNRALTPEFVKLYIRYIERMFPDLADCVKIYYYKSDGSQDSGRYWNTVQNLRKQSRKSGKIYFIVNQIVNGDSGGHGNLTIVCSGKNFLYDTVGSRADEEPTGHKDSSIEPNVTETKIQIDKWNCLVMVMGFMESLLKQFSKLREDWDKQKKSPSEWFLNEIQSPSEIELSDVIKTPDAEKTLNDMERKCLHTLLPKGYLQYLQTTTGIDNIVNKISPLNTAGHKYHKEITSIVNKLKKVQEKYFYHNYPISDFLFFDEYGIESNTVELPEEKAKIKNDLEELIRLNKWDDKISILQVKDAIRNILLCSQNKNSDKICNEDETDEVLKYSSKENRENVKNELNNKHIYQVFAGGAQQFTTESAQELWNFCNTINNIKNYNFKAQMKRFTVVNKVVSLVNVYTKQGGDISNEIKSIRNI